MLWNDNRRLGLQEDLTSYANFADWRSQSRIFEDMAAFTEMGADVTGVKEPYEVFGWRVGSRLFSILGVAPAIGRTFTDQEEELGHSRVAVLSDGFWRKRFGADPKAIGKTLLMDGDPYVIVGVMPPSFQFPDKRTEIWTPLATSNAMKANRGGFWLRVLGKMKPGATIEQARAEMTLIGTNLERQYPNTNSGSGVRVVPMLSQVVGNLRTGLLVLFAAVGFVLLIACANVANLSLARGARREREIAVRSALGAGRARLIRQLLTESFVLSVPAGAAGLLVAYWSLDALIALAPADMPRLSEIAIDGRVLWFTLGMSLVSALFFGLVPALRISRNDWNDALREGGRSVAGGLRASFARSSLLVAEVALSMVLLAGAGLMVRSLIHLRALNPGFDASGVLTMELSAPYAKFSKSGQVIALYERVMERLRALPMVRSSGLVTDIFLGATPNSNGFTVEGQPLPAPEQRSEATIDSVSPGYFEALRVPLIAGRFFDERDQPGSAPVALINETMARRFWPNEDPIGKRFHFGWGNTNVHWLTVAGVIGDMKRGGLDKAGAPGSIRTDFAAAALRSETGGPHGGRSAESGGSNSERTARGGERSGDPKGDHARSRDRRITGSAAVPDLAAGIVFRDRAAAGLHRYLRRDVPFGVAAHARVRRSGSARRGHEGMFCDWCWGRLWRWWATGAAIGTRPLWR